MPVNSKQKGSNFERLVSKQLSAWYGEDFHRTPGSGNLHSWGSDVRVRSDIVPPPDSTFPFSVECKKHEGWNLDQIVNSKGDFFNWWAQCSRDADEVKKIPLLLFSKNRSPLYFAMRETEYFKIPFPKKTPILGGLSIPVIVGLADSLFLVDRATIDSIFCINEGVQVNGKG